MRLVHALGSRWDEVNAIHLGLLRSAVEDHGGVVVRTEGDALFAAFNEARAATEAAVAAQRAITAHGWPEEAALAVRIGLHSGEAHLAGDDYGGFEVNRAARIAASGHGGQIVLSSATRALVADALRDGIVHPRPRSTRPARRPDARAAVPARRARAAEPLPPAAERDGCSRRPADEDDELRRARRRAGRDQRTARRPARRDAHRPRRDREDEPRGRGRAIPGRPIRRRGVVRGARRRRGSRGRPTDDRPDAWPA